MKIKSETRFHVKTLNQEKLLNKISKKFQISNVRRLNEKELCFSCDFLSSKNLQKFLKDNDIEILSIKHSGIFWRILSLSKSLGLIFALVFCSIFYVVQSQFILQYQIFGTENLQKTSIINFIDANFGRKISNIDTDNVEIMLADNFDEISFVSCIIKGQTLVLNIKEKLLPDEKYGTFQPIISDKDAKITEIELISGTLAVSVGDIVKAGDVLVEPFVINSAGETVKVEAQAKITAEVYYVGTSEHYDKLVEVFRTGRICEQNYVTLFGLNLYSFKNENTFELFEVESQTSDLVVNNFLPLKLKKTTIYELSERVVETDFEEVKDEICEKARQKALENCKNYDKIIDEYYTIRHGSGVTIVNFCVTTQEEIGEKYAD
jgi:sporulation protein YqfD